ncbi:hypothetical protein ALC60_10678, partial [Trachymyrmex zeteki]
RKEGKEERIGALRHFLASYIEIIKKFFRRLSDYNAKDQIIREFCRRNFHKPDTVKKSTYCQNIHFRHFNLFHHLLSLEKRLTGVSRGAALTLQQGRVSRHANTLQNPRDELPPSLSGDSADSPKLLISQLFIAVSQPPYQTFFWTALGDTFHTTDTVSVSVLPPPSSIATHSSSAAASPSSISFPSSPPPPLLSFISLIRPELKYITYTHNGLPLLCNGLDNDGHDYDGDDDDDDERNLNAKRSPTFNSVQFSSAVFRAVAVATRVVSRDVPLKPETIT